LPWQPILELKIGEISLFGKMAFLLIVYSDSLVSVFPADSHSCFDTVS